MSKHNTEYLVIGMNLNEVCSSKEDALSLLASQKEKIAKSVGLESSWLIHTASSSIPDAMLLIRGECPDYMLRRDRKDYEVVRTLPLFVKRRTKPAKVYKNTVYSKHVETYRHKLGDTIKKLRLGKGYSQEKLGELTGTTRYSILRIEKGERLPSYPFILEVALALGVSNVQFTEEVERSGAILKEAPSIEDNTSE